MRGKREHRQRQTWKVQRIVIDGAKMVGNDLSTLGYRLIEFTNFMGYWHVVKAVYSHVTF